MKIADKISERIDKSQGVGIKRDFVRNLSLAHIREPLGVDGSKFRDGRFHRVEMTESTNVGLGCFYLAANEFVTAAECVLNPFNAKSPRVDVWVSVDLNNVLDISSLAALRSNPGLELIREDEWEGFNMRTGDHSLSQLIGRHAFLQGYSGILYNSSKMDDISALNLCVFPLNFGPGESIEVIDPIRAYDLLPILPKAVLRIP